MFKGILNNIPKVRFSYILYRSKENAEFNFNSLRRKKDLIHIEMTLENDKIKLLSDNITYLKFEQEKFGKSSIQTIYSEL